MDFKMKYQIGFGFEKPKSVHLCRLHLWIAKTNLWPQKNWTHAVSRSV